MIIEKMCKDTGEYAPTTLKECLNRTEGSGYWKPDTVKEELEKGNKVFTPFYIYSKAKEQNCKCSTPLVYSVLTTECLRCGGNC